MTCEQLDPRVFLSVSLQNGILQVIGTENADTINIEISPTKSSQLRVTLNGAQWSYAIASVTRIFADGLAGNDQIGLGQGNGPIEIPATFAGGKGNDILIGGAGNDSLLGGEGNDQLYGIGGKDTLRGNAGRDALYGGKKRDNLTGNAGVDTIYGGPDADILHDVDGAAERIDQSAAETIIRDGLQYSQINDFAYQLQNINLTTIGNSKFDLAVIDYSKDADDASRWTRDQMAALQNSAGGFKRVLAYMSVGEAEDYRFYWQTKWDANHDGKPDAAAPSWLGDENPDWPGNYKVKYWDTNWQKIVFTYLDRVIDQGFDGVYLDIIDAFEYWGPDDTNIRPSADRDMVNFVKAIANYARVTKGRSDFAIFPQNGEALGKYSDYLQTITGIGHEDVYYNDDSLNSSADIKAMRTALNQFKSAGRAVFVIDYPQQPSHIDDFYARATVDGFVPLAADRELDSLGVVAGHEPD